MFAFRHCIVHVPFRPVSNPPTLFVVIYLFITFKYKVLYKAGVMPTTI